jgi:uncharacterized membrane protein
MMFFLQQLKAKNRLNIVLLFSVITVLCVSMVAFRIHYTSQILFRFLIWNIFLALIPYAISTLLVVYHERFTNRWFLLPPFLLWLCFFPNAPYLLTDLLHLRARPGVPFWYDLSLVLFFVWNGVMLGYASLLDIQTIVTKRFNKWAGWLIAIGSLILGSFGMYVGRYLRWNSWDVISSPEGLLHDIAIRIVNPFAHRQTYSVTLLYAAFLVLGYLLLVQFFKAYKNYNSAS